MSNRKDRTEALAAHSRFIMGDLQVHPDRLCVVREGQDIPLEPRAMEVLVILAEKAGKAMSSSQLQISVWKTEVFGDNAVSKTLSVLRKSLGDDTRSPRYIESLKGRGYRLIAPVAFPKSYRRVSITTEIWKHGSPFVGLAAFDAQRAAVFTGRSQVTGDFLDAMRGQIDSGRQFMLLAGPSGCGKTSLLRAGVLPLLTRADGFGGLHSLSVATCDLAATPGRDAMFSLANSLTSWVLEARPVFAQPTVELLRSNLKESPETVVSTISEAFRRYPRQGLDLQSHAHLLLVIDHAEALVTNMHTPDEIGAFERIVSAICDAPRTLVVMIVRGDYAPDLTQSLPALNERKSGGGHIDMLPPNPGEIAEIIREPALQAGLEFDVDEQRQRLDDKLRDAAIGQPDALPLLQHTLQLLYERRANNNTLTWPAYRDIGGLEGAISHRAEEVFKTLPIEAQASLDSVLARLVVIQSDNDAVTARHARMDPLPAHARTLVEAFVHGRLFVGELQDGEPHFGVVHEALLRQWPRAVEWVEENRRLLMAKARLRRAAERWDDEGRQDDHLLNPGRPLIEACEVKQRYPDDIGEAENSLLRASERMGRRRRFLSRVAIVALATLAVISTSLAVMATQASAIAKKNRNEALDLIGYMLVELSDQLRPTASTAPMKSISTRALNFLERQPVESMASGDLINYSRALRTKGEVLSLKGWDESANLLFKRADTIARRAIAMAPSSTQAISEAGQTSFWLGLQSSSSGNYEEAVNAWKQYRLYSERLLELEPNKPDWWQEHAYATANLGYLYQLHGDCELAMLKFNPAVKEMERAIAKKKEADIWRFNWIVARSMESRCQAQEGQIVEASRGYSQQIAELKALLVERPDAIDWEQQLSSLLHFNAALSADLGHMDDAEKQYLEAADRLTVITKIQPSDQSWKRGLANALMRASDIAYFRGDAAAAMARLRIAMRLVEAGLAAEDKEKWRRLNAMTLFRTGRYSANSVSERRMAAGIESLRMLSTSNPADTYARTALAEALISHGIWLRDSGKSVDARRDWDEARLTMAEISTRTKDPEILAPWVSANILTGRRKEVEKSIKALASSGYSHPNLIMLESWAN